MSREDDNEPLEDKNTGGRSELTESTCDRAGEKPIAANTDTRAGESDQAAPARLPMPDVGDLLFIGVLYVLLVAQPNYLFNDASVGWHLYTGKHIWETHSIPTVDLFSYTFPDKAWVAYEWLFDLICYLITLAGGMNLLAVASAGLIAYVLMKVYDSAREAGAPLAVATFASIVGIFASAVHWLARPHIVTFLAIYIYTISLEAFYRGRKTGKALFITLVLIMVLWVNIHPAFIFGLALIGVYLLVSFINALIERWKEKRAQSFLRNSASSALAAVRQVSTLIACLAASLAATLLNPYGWGLHVYIFKYLRGSTVLENTDEFLSPVFHGNLHALCLEVLFAFLVAGLAVSRKRISTPYLIVLLLFMHLSLSGVRNIPLFAIISVPAIGLLFSSTILAERLNPLSSCLVPADKSDDSQENAQKDALNPLASFARKFHDFDLQEMHCKMRILAKAVFLIAVIAALEGGKLFGITLFDCDFSKKRVPTATLDYIKDHKLPYNRGFNFDNWGGLIRYKLGQRVFIDDRADFYGEQFYKQYGSIVQTRPGWQKLLDKLRIEWILIPKDAHMAPHLKEEPQWQLAAEDAGSLLFIRTSAAGGESS